MKLRSCQPLDDLALAGLAIAAGSTVLVVLVVTVVYALYVLGTVPVQPG